MFVPARRLSFGWSMVAILVVFVIAVAQGAAQKNARPNYVQKMELAAERRATVQKEAALTEITQVRTDDTGIGWYRGKTADGRTLQVWLTEEGWTLADEAIMLAPNAAKAKAEAEGWIRMAWNGAPNPTVKWTWEFTGSRPEWEGAWASVGINALTGEIKYAPPVAPRLEPEEWDQAWVEAAQAKTPLRQVERIEYSRWRVTYFLIGPDATGRQVQAWMQLKEPPKANPGDQVYADTSYQKPVPTILGYVYLDEGISRAKALELAEATGLIAQEQPVLDWLPQPLWFFTAQQTDGRRVHVKVDWKSGAVSTESYKP